MSEEKKTTKKAQEAKAEEEGVVTAPASEIPSAAVVTAAQVGIFVYIGPSLPNGLMKKGSVFKGTKAEVLKHFENITAKYPEVAQLLIAGDKLAEAKARVKTGGNLLTNSYTKLVDRIKNK